MEFYEMHVEHCTFSDYISIYNLDHLLICLQPLL